MNKIVNHPQNHDSLAYYSLFTSIVSFKLSSATANISFKFIFLPTATAVHLKFKTAPK